MKKYTVAAVICRPPANQPVWSGEVEVEADNVREATDIGTNGIKQTASPRPGDFVQIVRVQQHTDTVLNGEVQELQDYGADFAPDRLYRYGLYRIWDKKKSLCMFIGLNPSSADEKVNDNTVRRCIRFSRDLGYGGLIMTNAFAFRATNKQALRHVQDPVGPDNDTWLQNLSRRAAIVIAAWGNDGALNGRSQQIRQLIPKLHCLGLTGAGEPKHPLYLAADLKPIQLQ
jgi:hypothetical protein